MRTFQRAVVPRQSVKLTFRTTIPTRHTRSANTQSTVSGIRAWCTRSTKSINNARYSSNLRKETRITACLWCSRSSSTAPCHSFRFHLVVGTTLGMSLWLKIRLAHNWQTSSRSSLNEVLVATLLTVSPNFTTPSKPSKFSKVDR